MLESSLKQRSPGPALVSQPQVTGVPLRKECWQERKGHSSGKLMALRGGLSFTSRHTFVLWEPRVSEAASGHLSPCQHLTLSAHRWISATGEQGVLQARTKSQMQQIEQQAASTKPKSVSHSTPPQSAS